MKVGDLVRFPGLGVIHDHGEFGMIVEIYGAPPAWPPAGGRRADVFWSDGDFVHGYIAGDLEVISESR